MKTEEWVRPTIDEIYLEMAKVLAGRAACTRRQVGALVVDADGRIVASGYNGAPSGEKHCTDGGCPRGMLSRDECATRSAYDNCVAIHAEANALLRAGLQAKDATIYITCAPCHECARLVTAAGISRVVYPVDSD